MSNTATTAPELEVAHIRIVIETIGFRIKVLERNLERESRDLDQAERHVFAPHRTAKEYAWVARRASDRIVEISYKLKTLQEASAALQAMLS